MGFYIQDDYWKGIEDLPRSQQDKAMGAMVRFFFIGEEPDNLKGAAKTAFFYARERIEIAKKRADAGKSKRQSKQQSNEEQNANQNGNQNGNQNPILLAKSESESESTCTAAAASNVTVGDSSSKKSFIKSALKIYNSEFSTTLKRFGAKVESVLGEAYDAGYTLDDIALLVEFDHANGDADKRSPNGIFGDHFEVLVAKAKSWKAKQEEIEHNNHTLRVIAESSPDAWMQNYEVQA